MRRKFSRVNLVEILVPFIIMSFFCVLTTIIIGISFEYAFKFILFQLVGILLPGAMLVVLLEKKELSSIEFGLYSYIAGFSIAYLGYFLTVPFHNGKYLMIVYLIIIIFLGVLVCIKGKDIKIYSIKNDRAIAWGCILFFLSISMVSMASSNFLPNDNYGINSYYQDNLYFCGNIAELAKEFPPVNFRAFFQSYSYHYFYTIQLAVLELITKIPAYEVGTFFSYIQVDYVLALTVTLLVNTLIKADKVLTKFFVIFSMFMLPGIERITAITNSAAFSFVPMGLDFSCAMGFLMIVLAIKQTENKNVDPNQLLLFAWSFFLCMGTKGPTGLVYGFVCGCIYLFDLIKNKNTKVFWSNIIVLIIISFALVLIVYSDNISSTISVAGEGVGQSIYSLDLMQSVIKIVDGYVGNRLIREFIYMAVYVFSINPLLVTILCIKVLLAIFGIVNWDKVDGILLLGFIVCFIAARIFCHPGLSQVYFLQSFAPLLAILSLRGIVDFLSEIQYQIRYYLGMLCVISICIVYTILGSQVFLFNEFSIQPFLRGYNYICGREVITNGNWNINSMTKDEFEAYRWIRENTPSKSRLLCDTLKSGYGPYAYCPGVFSERHCYVPLDKTDLCEKYISGDTEAANEVRKMEIEYLVLSSRITGMENEYKVNGEIVYKNDGVRVYRLIQ